MYPGFDIPHAGESLSQSLSQALTLSTLWKLLFVLLLLGNLKNLPLVWHTRLLNGFRFVLRSERSRAGPTPAQLFQPMITASHAPLTEIDYNIHKSNSTYFSDLDIARSHLLCTLFSVGIEEARKSKPDGIIGGGNTNFGVALGAVSCSFRKELRPYEQYEMWTRVLSWDQKWLYLVTHFVRKDKVKPRAFSLYPSQNGVTGELKQLDRKEDAIVASALSKCVFKKGRLTIAPETMLQASGLLPPRPGDNSQMETKTLPLPTKRDLSADILDVPFRAFEAADAMWDAAKQSLFPQPPVLVDDGFVNGLKKQEAEEWTWRKIEVERARGMELANLLRGLEGLEQEFTADAEALGRHSDLWWLLGLTY